MSGRDKKINHLNVQQNWNVTSLQPIANTNIKHCTQCPRSACRGHKLEILSIRLIFRKEKIRFFFWFRLKNQKKWFVYKTAFESQLSDWGSVSHSSGGVRRRGGSGRKERRLTPPATLGKLGIKTVNNAWVLFLPPQTFKGIPYSRGGQTGSGRKG